MGASPVVTSPVVTSPVFRNSPQDRVWAQRWFFCLCSKSMLALARRGNGSSFVWCWCYSYLLMATRPRPQSIIMTSFHSVVIHRGHGNRQECNCTKTIINVWYTLCYWSFGVNDLRELQTDKMLPRLCFC